MVLIIELIENSKKWNNLNKRAGINNSLYELLVIIGFPYATKESLSLFLLSIILL